MDEVGNFAFRFSIVYTGRVTGERKLNKKNLLIVAWKGTEENTATEGEFLFFGELKILLGLNFALLFAKFGVSIAKNEISSIPFENEEKPSFLLMA